MLKFPALRYGLDVTSSDEELFPIRIGIQTTGVTSVYQLLLHLQQADDVK